MVVVVTAFIATVVDVVLELVDEVELDVEVDDVVWVATRVVLVVEVVEVVEVVDVVEVEVVVDVGAVVVDVVVVGGGVVVVVDVVVVVGGSVVVVEVVVDVVVVVVVLGVAEATSDATLRPLMFSAFTVTAYVEPLVSDPTAHCNGCTSLTNVEQPSTPFKYTW